MTETEIEAVLDVVVGRLNGIFKSGSLPADSDVFEDWVARELDIELAVKSLPLLKPRVKQQFPDLVADNMGIEVKYVVGSPWSGVANSISESHRIPGIKTIYLIFGRGSIKKSEYKLPKTSIFHVKWAKYEEVIYHARTSHRPRFQINMITSPKRPSLFKRWGIDYKDFASLTYPQKMGYMQAYARLRGKTNKKLDFWWVPPIPRPYVDLSLIEKNEALALACLMCPQIITGSKEAKKEVAICMQVLKGVLSHETSLLFSASPVTDLQRIEKIVATEAHKATYDVFEMYWNSRPDRKDRLFEWVQKLDAAFDEANCSGPRPSAVLFGGQYAP